MLSPCRRFCHFQSHLSLRTVMHFKFPEGPSLVNGVNVLQPESQGLICDGGEALPSSRSISTIMAGSFSSIRLLSMVAEAKVSPSKESSDAAQTPPRVKFKRLDKTARHIMQILDRESVEEVRAEREIPEIRPGYIIELKVEVPENKRRVSLVKGIVIAKRKAGLNTTIRLRRLVAGVGIETVYPLYSPNIKDIKVLEKKKVRRAKLYYLREQMNPLKK